MVRRALFGALAGCALAVGALAGALLAGGASPALPRQASAGIRGALGAFAPAPLTRAELPPGVSVVANVVGGEALVYRKPGERRARWRYSNPTAEHTPLVFLVRRRIAGWVRVLLPSRPNGSEGWLRERGLALQSDRYALLVSLRRRRLLVLRDGRPLLSAAAGIGRGATPTPPGLYYITELLRQPDPLGSYGPWAFALSAFSPVLTRFGSGGGQVGLHGTDDPSGIGHTVSHGCIRVRNEIIERLARVLPLGTPVRILGRASSSHERNRRV
jgi:L,D-transpeptidase-like protein